MLYYIEEWPDGRASLMHDSGHHINTFNTLEDAVSAYEEWSEFNQLANSSEHDDDAVILSDSSYSREPESYEVSLAL